MLDDNDRDAAVLQLANERSQVKEFRLGQPDGRLIEENEQRIPDGGAREVDELELSDAEDLHRPVRMIRQVEEPQLL